MDMNALASGGMVVLGCGKMGSALLQGWLDQGMPPSSVWGVDPHPSDWLSASGVHVNVPLPASPSFVLIAVKPQMMGKALPRLRTYAGGGTVFLSVAAGVTLARYAAILGAKAKVIRAMPNTPAAIGQGITALIGNAHVGEADMAGSEALMQAVGQTVRLTDEAQMDAVTGVSGSGPAYVFYMIETLAAAGVAQGLPPDLSMQLAKATVAGAGALAQKAAEPPAILRQNVTSPNGTTQAGLEVLMDERTGLPPLIARTVAAATARAKELANG